MPAIRECTACRQEYSWTGGPFTCSPQCAITHNRLRSADYQKRKQVERREEKIRELTQTNKILTQQVTKMKITLEGEQICWNCDHPLRFTSTPNPRFVHTFTTSNCSEYPTEDVKPIPKDGMVGC